MVIVSNYRTHRTFIITNGIVSFLLIASLNFIERAYPRPLTTVLVKRLVNKGFVLKLGWLVRGEVNKLNPSHASKVTFELILQVALSYHHSQTNIYHLFSIWSYNGK